MTGKIKDLNFFLKQIQDDIDNIKEEYSYLNENILKDEYAFNYWILSRIFNIDEELIETSITEYNDKGIDCFVHFEENKELLDNEKEGLQKRFEKLKAFNTKNSAYKKKFECESIENILNIIQQSDATQKNLKE